MDEDLNPESSNSSAKRSKLDNEENDSSMSNTDDKVTVKSTPMDTVPIEIESNERCAEGPEEQLVSYDTEATGMNITTSKPEISGCNTVDKKNEDNNSTTSELPKENDKKSEESMSTKALQNEETAEATENSGNNDAAGSSKQQQQDQNDKKTNNGTGGGSSSYGARRLGVRRRNYRTRVVSSSSDESDDIDDGREAAGGTASNLSSRRKRTTINLSSSTDTESNSNSVGGNDDDSDSTSMSITYPDFDTMDYDDSNSSSSNKESETNTLQEILQSNKKPNYNWSSLYEIMYREHGLSGHGRQTMIGRNAYSFQSRFYSARHVVEKMKLLHKLEKHQGCVNSLNFNKDGTLLVSGSDDLKIILWNWAKNKIAYAFKSGHTSNVFQTKFVDLAAGGINIVSSGRDGQVRHATIPPSGGKVISTVLLKHFGAVHKITPTQNPYEILTAGEDGHVVHFDLREPPVERLVTVKMNRRKVPLYSIAHHPFESEFCVCGRNQFVYVYDKRNTKKPSKLLYPKHLEDIKPFVSHITCAVYNSTGSEILASYSDEDIYLFNNKCCIPGSFLHRYRGHNNRKTIKGVNFFGLNSEYVVSGSDCGNFFFWNKETESIINWMRGDITGVVNCLEPHPSFPVLATSGLDADVKIWVPLRDQYPPPMEGLEKCVKHNTKRSVMPDNDIFDDRTLFFFVHHCLRNRSNAQTDENCPNVQDLVSSSSSDDEQDLYLRRTLPCSPQ